MIYNIFDIVKIKMNLPHYTTTLINKKQLTDDVFEFHLTKPAGFEFQAGQFVEFTMSHDKETILRSYSIASSPEDKDLLFFIKIIPNGKASACLEKIQIKESVVI